MRFHPVPKSVFVFAGVMAIAAPARADNYADAIAALAQAHNPAAAVAALTRAADAGNAEAQAFLAGMYKTGIGVPQDKTKASVLYQQAFASLEKTAAQGDIAAMLFLSDVCLEGGDVAPKDKAKAALWIQKAAEAALVQKAIVSADAHSLSYLAYQYRYGRGLVAKDIPKAKALYEKAAGMGDIDSLRELGGIYLIGEGVPKDTEKSVTYFQRYIEQELKTKTPNVFVTSHIADNLSETYAKGEGVPPDPVKARYWQQKAEEIRRTRHTDKAMAYRAIRPKPVIGSGRRRVI